jgi:hypothetical protein
MGYQCWGEDHEDLTEKVEVAKAALPPGGGKVVVFGLKGPSRRSKPPEPRLVMVTCAKGHENVFEVG